MLLGDTTQNLKVAPLTSVVLRGEKMLSAMTYSQRIAGPTQTQGKFYWNQPYSSREEFSMKMSEMKRPATKRLHFFSSIGYFIMPWQVQFAVWQAIGFHFFWWTFTTQWQKTTSPDKESHLQKRITIHQLSSKAINSWRELLVDPLSTAKTQTEAEWGRAETRRERSKLGH